MSMLIGIHVILAGEHTVLSALERGDHVAKVKTVEAKQEPTKPTELNANVSRSDHHVNHRDTRTSVSHSSTIEVTATAYTAFCDTGCTGVTATGVDVSNTVYHEGKRVIATDPNVIPLGTDVTLRLADGRTIDAVAADTGRAIKGNRIDVLVSSREKAINFGLQRVEVEIH